MPNYKLTYFPVEGLGEPIRFLFSYADIKFEDDRFKREDWPKLKPNMPFGQVPVLDVDGKKINQSVAICRYLAKQCKLVGKDDWENLEIDSTVDNIHDLRSNIASWFYDATPASKETKAGPLFDKTIPMFMERLDGQVKSNGGYFVGGKLTWADLVFAGLIGYLNSMVAFNLLEKYSNLKTLNDKVLAIEQIKAWVAKRPKA